MKKGFTTRGIRAADSLGKILKESYKWLTPEDFAAMLNTATCNFFGPVPKEYFDAVVKEMESECGEPNCTCHLHGVKIAEGFKLARIDWQREMSFRRKKN